MYLDYLNREFIKLRVLIILIFTFNINSIYSQNFSNEKNKLLGFKLIKELKYDSYEKSWSNIFFLKKGEVTECEIYFKNNLRSKLHYIYNDDGALIYEISIYKNKNILKVDTINKYTFKKDDKKRIIEKNFNSIFYEEYSNFNNNGLPTVIKAFNFNKDTLTNRPFKKILSYDGNGNIKKEISYIYELFDLNEKKLDNVKFEADTIISNKWKYILAVESNYYSYDNFNNIIEIKRERNPERDKNSVMTGGRPIYDLEKYYYSYNKYGLWTKMYWILNGKKSLIKKRMFKK